MARGQSVLVATLGAEPQVITLTLDCLLRMGERISQVKVLHTAPSTNQIRASLEALKDEFAAYPAYQDGLELSLSPILHDGKPIKDVTTRDEALAVLRNLYRTLNSLKRQGDTIHLCPAGGRKAMAMYSVLAAQLIFNEQDRLWLLFSTETLRLQRSFHAGNEEASLARIPVLPWRFSLPEKRRFIRTELSKAESEVLELLAREGLGDKEIGSRRHTSRKTVESQLTEVRRKFEVAAGLDKVDRQLLIAEFSPYFLLDDSLEDLLTDEVL